MQRIWQDRREQWKALSIRKVANFFGLWLSYHLSRLTRRPLHWGGPFSLSIEPTTACNLGCPECPSGLKQFTRATGKLSKETLNKLLDQTQRTLGNIIFYFQGEPYLHPEFTDLVKTASDRGIYTTTSTNAHFLDEKQARKTVESGLSRLIISIDGTTQETYEQYRVHGSLEKVLAGTRNILKAREEMGSTTPHVIFQFLVVKPNEHQIDDVHKLAAELGVDEVRLKTAQVYDYENGNPLIPDDTKYSRYRQQKDGTWTIKNKLLNQCWRMWQGCVITWDGKVVPCCFDKDATHQLGDTAEDGFHSIWNGPAYHDFRQSILQSRDQIDICTNCTEGTKVWAEE
ncbi:radical SAM/SPASM domain-containing protein [Sanyastnella coralliicola]|uniref:radical SAM/SPASM domain-containing protein n=1 Tax=Sanyastnella coralliicola TaxID=3069118 RepID=UPI0027BB0742|nr:radical SAM/SPASM domain-containing protein [Longitalea sp. SCSIO 12813]